MYHLKKGNVAMRALILSFFAVLLGYSLLFDGQAKEQASTTFQGTTGGFSLAMPEPMDTLKTYTSWLDKTPAFGLLKESIHPFRGRK